MTDTIKPPNAASLWVTKDILYVELPDGEGNSHTLRIPNNTFGMAKIVQILTARTEKSKIATKGDLTQFQTDRDIQEAIKGFDLSKIIRPKIKIKPNEGQRGMIREIMRRIGI